MLYPGRYGDLLYSANYFYECRKKNSALEDINKFFLQ